MEMYSLHEGEGLFNKIEVSLDFLFTTLLIGGRDFREGLSLSLTYTPPSLNT